jgi:hypothetical protein
MAEHSMRGGPDDGTEAPPARPLELPDDEVPCAVPVQVMLAHTDKLAVFVAELLVYSTGLTFALQLAQHSSFADQRLVDAWLQPPHLVGKDRPFFGVDYADDRYTVHDSWAADDPAVATLAEVAKRRGDRWPVLKPTGGRGRIGRYEVDFYLSPLPPPKELRFVLAWPSQDLAESSAVVDADDIVRAADRVRQLWPRQPEPEPAAPDPGDRPRPIPPPASGWFASHSGPPHA